MKKISKLSDRTVFWEIAAEYLNHYLPDIRRMSSNTVFTYRTSLNCYIDYLETEKGKERQQISFQDFGKDNLSDYFIWMSGVKNLSPKTCNLRLSAIRTLLDYGSQECIDLISIYVGSLTIKGLRSSAGPIEYFEGQELSALFKAPDCSKKTGRRNQMMLIIGYDAALRIGELVSLKVKHVHLDAAVPYISIPGKGMKYRNVPIMKKTHTHLKQYLAEFHPVNNGSCPLFYTTTHEIIHELSTDAVEAFLKKYTRTCIESEIHMPEHVHFHMFRKTRAMDLYRQSIPLAHIQQMLGHECISTTSGFYAFASIETLARSLEKVNPTTESKSWKNEEAIKKLYRL